MTPEEYNSPPLDKEVTKHIQGIVGALLYYAKSVDNTLLVVLSSVGYQQAAATKRTNKAINKLINYIATYPADQILYRSNDMLLCAHFDSGFHNKSKGRIRTGDNIFLSENDPMPWWNGPVLTLSHMIKFVMSTASEAEVGVLFVTAQEMVAMKNTCGNEMALAKITHTYRQLRRSDSSQKYYCPKETYDNEAPHPLAHIQRWSRTV